MSMYQNKLLILAFLIAGYSGYVNAGEENASTPSENTRSADVNAQAEKSSTDQDSQTAKQHKKTKKHPTKQTASTEAQDNQKITQNKKECVFKGVMSDEDYYTCKIRPYKKIIYFRRVPLE